METQPRGPVLGALETQLSFEEAQSLCAMEDAPHRGLRFHGRRRARRAACQKRMARLCAEKRVPARGRFARRVLFATCCFTTVILRARRWLAPRCTGVRSRAAASRGRISAPAPWRMCAFPAVWRKAPLFSECGMKAVLFEQTDLSGAAFSDISLRRRAVFAFRECSLAGAQFLHTPLAGQNFATCNIEGHCPGRARAARRARHGAAGVRAGKAAGRYCGIGACALRTVYVFILTAGGCMVMKAYLEAGQFVTTHGVLGELKLYPWADGPEFIACLPRLYISPQGGAPLELERVRAHKGMCIVKAAQGGRHGRRPRLYWQNCLFCPRGRQAAPPGAILCRTSLAARCATPPRAPCTARCATSRTPPRRTCTPFRRRRARRCCSRRAEFLGELCPQEGYVTVRPIPGMFDGGEVRTDAD